MKNSHVVVVGGTKGIGRAAVRLFANRGARVSIIGRTASPELDLHNQHIRLYRADLLQISEIDNALQSCFQENGEIAHLLFFQRYRGPADDWQGEIKVSLDATKKIIDFSKSLFDKSYDNSIVIIGSIAGRYVLDEQPISYHLVKAAILQMVRYYAVALGPLGIRVNCVTPDSIIKEEALVFYEKQKEFKDLLTSIIPMRRMGTAEDVANVIEFLCSSKAAYVTGQELVVDGGLSVVGNPSIARKVANLDDLKITR